MHNCDFKWSRRIGKVVKSKCGCGKSKTILIKGMTPEKAAEIDKVIEALKKGK